MIKGSIPVIRLLILLYSPSISALQCLSCQNVADKRDCHSIQSCGAHQECYTNRVIDGSGRNLYNLGCVDQYIGERNIRPFIFYYPAIGIHSAGEKVKVLLDAKMPCR